MLKRTRKGDAADAALFSFRTTCSLTIFKRRNRYRLRRFLLPVFSGSAARSDRVLQLESHGRLTHPPRAAIGGSLVDAVPNRVQFCFGLRLVDVRSPLPGLLDRPPGQDALIVRVSAVSSPATAPTPFFCRLAKIGPQRIAFHVT